MTLRRLSYLLAAAATMALAACSADGGDTPGGDTPQEGAAVSVPLTVSFSGEWSTDDEGGGTRVAPPEQGDTNGDGAITDADLIGGREELEPVNRVRIITFRRKDADVTGQPSGSFEYDPTNDITATCKWNADNTLKTAKATLTKLYSYEYRVVAIAYDADEESWFSLNDNRLDGLKFEDFEVEMKRQDKKSESVIGDFTHDRLHNGNNFGNDEFEVVFTPQFFYGYCHLDGNDDPIIKYGETEEETKLPLTGRLYRAVAKVEMELEINTIDILGSDCKIEQAVLVMNNVYTTSGMTDYDDFLSPDDKVKVGNENYTVVDFVETVPNHTIEENKERLRFEAYVLPTKTKLALGAKVTYVIEYSRVGWFNSKNISYADGATGVISPDVYNNEFYFRRNHKYLITGKTSNAIPSKN